MTLRKFVAWMTHGAAALDFERGATSRGVAAPSLTNTFK
jgi:hypothetical protein